MAEAATCRPLTVDTQVRSQVCPCKIYGGPSSSGTDASPSTSAFPCQYHPINAPCTWYMLLLPEEQTGKAWELLNKSKGKVIPLQARCDPEGGYRYSSTLP